MPNIWLWFKTGGPWLTTEGEQTGLLLLDIVGSYQGLGIRI